MRLQKNVAKFYKYQPLFDVKHFEYIKNYISQKIWITPLRNFNDPFEVERDF